MRNGWDQIFCTYGPWEVHFKTSDTKKWTHTCQEEHIVGDAIEGGAQRGGDSQGSLSSSLKCSVCRMIAKHHQLLAGLLPYFCTVLSCAAEFAVFPKLYKEASRLFLSTSHSAVRSTPQPDRKVQCGSIRN